MHYAHLRFFLRLHVICAFRLKGAWRTRHAVGVGYCGARGLRPVARLAQALRNAHVDLFLGLIICRSVGSETTSTASSARSIRCSTTPCLRPLSRQTLLVGCALGGRRSSPKLIFVTSYARSRFQNKFILTRYALRLAIFRTTRTCCGRAILARALVLLLFTCIAYKHFANFAALE